MAEDLDLLEEEFSPPVDSSLVHALYHEYSHEPGGLAQARDTLEALKQSALAEQYSEFDPSGSSGYAARSSPRGQSSEDTGEDWTSQTTVTESTNLSNDFSGLSVGEKSGSGSEDSVEVGYFRQAEQLDTPTKELLLAETFPRLRFDLVVFTLKKCDNDFERATDELLNHVYFEESRSSATEENAPVPKGVEGYGEQHQLPTRKKGKGKKKNNRALLYDQGSPSMSESDVTVSSSNRWEAGYRDVEFITKHTKLSTATASSTYHKNGASLTATLISLIDQDIAKENANEIDPSLAGKAVDLTENFPAIGHNYAVSIIRLTTPSLVSAHEISKALTTSTGKFKGSLNVIPQYSPVQLSSPEDDDTTTSSSTPRLPTLAPTATPHTASSLLTARNHAFAQATTAHRRGRSDRNLRGVSSYYSQLGRDLNANLRAMTAIESDAFVASNSSPARLDLHGVTVANAVRIAKRDVRVWWEGLGEARIPGRGVKEGFTIITGLGRHSEGGRARIGPAVVRALVGEGWKVEVSGGEVVVWGRQRRG